jgi:hypothetical protein
MRTLVRTAALALLIATTACTIHEKCPDHMSNPHHQCIKDGKMMDGSMSKDMMERCHNMMQGKSHTKKSPDVNTKDHKKHH